MSKLADIVYKRQKALVPLAIFLTACAIGFKFSDGGTKWVWSDYPLIAILLALTAVLISWIWAAIEKQKFQSLIDDLKEKIAESSDQKANKLNELSTKQREVFDLIVKGRSNKEIMAELFIELSTLKSHINQIYKKLGITGRKEIRSLADSMNKGI